MIQPNFVAGYIVDLSGQEEPMYLLLRRSQSVYLPGIWQIVTGKLELNETVGDAVQREILEETGLVCNELYNVDVTMYYDQSKNRIAFSANFCGIVNSAKQVTLSAKEHDASRWCTFTEAFDLLAFPAQKETLSLIHKHYVLQRPDSVNKLRNLKS